MHDIEPGDAGSRFAAAWLRSGMLMLSTLRIIEEAAATAERARQAVEESRRLRSQNGVRAIYR